MPLPITETRLASSLSIIAVHQTSSSGMPFDPLKPLSTASDLIEFAASLKTIGATFGFRVSQTSTNYQRRGINSAREPFAGVPGPLNTTLAMDRAALYKEDAISAFDFLPGNAAFQTRPLMIIENVELPSDVDYQRQINLSEALSSVRKAREAATGLAQRLLTGGETVPIVYMNCWISDSRINYDLKSSDLMVVHNITLNVGRIVQPSSLIPVIGETITRTLAENVFVLPAIAGIRESISKTKL